MVRFVTFNHLYAVTVATLFAVSLSACSQREEIATYEESASETTAPGNSLVSGPVPHTPPERLIYETPEGWLPGQGGIMRKAAFLVERDGKKIEITVIDLTAQGGGLLANINRWRGQIRLSEISQEEMEKSVKNIEVGGAQGQYVELMGPEGDQQQAILAVVANRGGRTWFFKLLGDADLALQEKQRFQKFVKSVKFEAHGSETAQASTPNAAKGAPAARQLLHYTAPDGWSPAKVGGMRKAAFQIKDGEQVVEVTVIDLPSAAGGWLPNVNRWRNQIGLEPVTREELDAQLRPVKVAGEQAHYVELVGPKEAILGVIALHKDRSWFFKMIGDADLVHREKDRFDEFVKSVTFVEAGDEND